MEVDNNIFLWEIVLKVFLISFQNVVFFLMPSLALIGGRKVASRTEEHTTKAPRKMAIFVLIARLTGSLGSLNNQ